jgi:hypothetical protein
LSAQTRSFAYDVRRTQDGVRVTIRDYHWKRFMISLLWAMIWVLAAMKAFSAWDKNFFFFLSIPFCALLAVLGAFNVVKSVLSHTLILSPAELRVRTSFFGLTRTTLIDLGDVIDFGFGHYGHSQEPVLKLEVRASTTRGTKWFVLAREVTERAVHAFLQDVEAQGLQLPHYR